MKPNTMRINFNVYYPDRASVIKTVVVFAEIYLGRFDSRGYANCVLVGPEPGWENGRSSTRNFISGQAQLFGARHPFGSPTALMVTNPSGACPDADH